MNDYLNNFSSALDVLYDALKAFILKNGGFINLTDNYGKDAIYSLEFVAMGEVCEWNVLGVRVINDRIEYCAEYESACIYEDDELIKEFEWYDLKCTDNYYIQTLSNICEMIEQYV